MWWWWLGEEARRRWLYWIGRDAGYGRAPSDMVDQLEWLLMHRLEDLQGMVLLFLLVSAAGVIEGNARRQAIVLSGFGLRRLQAGRVLVLGWLGLVALCVVAPVALPYEGVALALSGVLLLGMYTVGRGSAAGSLGGIMGRLVMIGMLLGLIASHPVGGEGRPVRGLDQRRLARTSWRRRAWTTWAGRCGAAWRRDTRSTRRRRRCSTTFRSRRRAAHSPSAPV